LYRNEEIKLADFGNLKDVSGNRGGLTTQTTGTWGFMPREEMKGSKFFYLCFKCSFFFLRPTKASDIFALGCTMYNIMACVPPFTAPNVCGTVALVVEGKYSPLSGPYSEDLKNLVYSMMDKVFFFYFCIILLYIPVK
jgi:serine/threonine protein kinase